MKQRKWIYVHHPTMYDIRCDKCWDGDINGTGMNIDWSEYEHCIWCYDCKKDIEGFGGIFTGPIPSKCIELFGISLNRIYLKSGKMMKPVTAKDGRRIIYRMCSTAEKATFVKRKLEDK